MAPLVEERLSHGLPADWHFFWLRDSFLPALLSIHIPALRLLFSSRFTFLQNSCVFLPVLGEGRWRGSRPYLNRPCRSVQCIAAGRWVIMGKGSCSVHARNFPSPRPETRIKQMCSHCLQIDKRFSPLTLLSLLLVLHPISCCLAPP